MIKAPPFSTSRLTSSNLSMVTVKPPHQRRKRNNLGRELDGPVEVIWSGDWKPAQKYIKNVTLHNKSLTLLKIKFTPPTSRNFSSPYGAEKFEMAPGSSKELPIVFRPSELVPYSDFVRIETKDGSYEIRLEARLQVPRFQFPDTLKFSPTPVKEHKSEKFIAHNRSSVETPFRWEVFPDNFHIQPAEGIVKPRDTQEFVITFRSDYAAEYKGVGECFFGPELEYSRKMNILATSMWPKLHVGTGEKKSKIAKVDFGNINFGDEVERKVKIYNSSDVVARVSVLDADKRDGDVIPSPFKCLAKSLVIAPHKHAVLPIKFKPHCSSNVNFRRALQVACADFPEMCSLTVECTGCSLPAKLEFSENIIDFGRVRVGTKPNVSIRIDNTSDNVAKFQFMCDSTNSVWSFEPCHGILAKGEHKYINVTFEPLEPAPYNRKVPIFIEGAPPQFIQLSGSAYTDLIKPAHVSVEQLKLRFSADAEKTPLARRQAMLEAGELIHDRDVIRLRDEPYPVASENVCATFFEDDTESVPAISLSTYAIDFGTCLADGSINSHPIQVTNHTKDDIIAQWYNSETTSFSVYPNKINLRPGKSAIFTARFVQSKGKESLYGAEMELSAFFKDMMDYTEVKTNLVTPSWCATVNLTANTFAPQSEAFPSSVEIPEDIIMNPSFTSYPTYRTICMNNSSTLPALYSFSGDNCQIYPKVGKVRSEIEFKLVMVRTVTQAPASVAKATAKLNGDGRYDQSLTVRTPGGAPVLDYDNDIYIQPTMLSGTSRTMFRIQSNTRLPINYQWVFPENEIAIRPEMGVIEPLGTQEFEVSFSPTKVIQYLLKPELKYWANRRDVHASHVRVISEGLQAAIEPSSKFVDFGSLKVNCRAEKKVKLLNQSNCAVRVALSTKMTLNGEECASSHLLIEDNNKAVSELFLEPRCSQNLYLILDCPKDGKYTFDIEYSIGTETGLLVHVTADVCYPLLGITHVSCSDLQLLYKWSGVAEIDSRLRSTPLAEDLEDADYTKLDGIDVNLGSSTIGADPFSVRFELINPGSTDVRFKFLFPADLRLELESWADANELSDSQTHILQVEDNRLFQVKPRSATLAPNERCVVRLNYAHHLVGTHSLPVILSIFGGRQLPLKLSGTTLSKKDIQIHLPCQNHALKDVELNDIHPPIQDLELYNGSNKKISYSIDLAPLEDTKKENWDWPIFQVITPKGSIEPHSTGIVKVRFAPLEAKQYQVTLNLDLGRGLTQELCIKGSGVDPRNSPKESADLEARTSFLTNGRNIECSTALCRMNIDRLRLGEVPLDAPIRRLVFISNQSDAPVFFNWSGLNECVSVVPSKGKIEGSAQRTVVVEFKAPSAGGSAVHNVDLHCEVTSESDQITYLANLHAWNMEKKRQKEEFTITDKHRKPKQVRLIDSQEESPSRPVTPYKTLPPISPRVIETRRRGMYSRGRPARKEHVWYKPLPPKADVLPLNVSARTFELSQYLERTSGNRNEFFISAPADGNAKKISKEKVSASEDEITLLKTITGNVLRTLVDDDAIQEQLFMTGDEKIPFYSQFENAIWPPQRSSLMTNLLSTLEEEVKDDHEKTFLPPPTPQNSVESNLSIVPKSDEATPEEAKILEDVMSKLIASVMVSATVGDCVLTAEPRKIMVKPE